jgi:hypothetical protein
LMSRIGTIDWMRAGHVKVVIIDLGSNACFGCFARAGWGASKIWLGVNPVWGRD